MRYRPGGHLSRSGHIARFAGVNGNFTKYMDRFLAMTHKTLCNCGSIIGRKTLDKNRETRYTYGWRLADGSHKRDSFRPHKGCKRIVRADLIA